MHIIFGLILTALFLYLIPTCLYLTPKDFEHYRTLMQENMALIEHSAIDLVPIKQLRQGVSKEIWLSDANRSHLNVDCATSRLTLLPKGDKLDIFEVFDQTQGKHDQHSFQYSALSGYADPKLLFLEGDLHLLFELDGKKSLALADSATYDPHQKKLILQSLPTSKVLFRQDEVSLSAKRVEIKDKIEGIGDVRLYFTTDEKLQTDAFW